MIRISERTGFDKNFELLKVCLICQSSPAGGAAEQAAPVFFVLGGEKTRGKNIMVCGCGWPAPTCTYLHLLSLQLGGLNPSSSSRILQIKEPTCTGSWPLLVRRGTVKSGRWTGLLGSERRQPGPGPDQTGPDHWTAVCHCHVRGKMVGKSGDSLWTLWATFERVFKKRHLKRGN